MKVAYQDDQERGAGKGLLVIKEILAPEGPWSIAIQRASDQNYLTGKKTGQWLGEAYFIPVQGEVNPNGSLSLQLGPAIVDSLDQKEQYRVTLKGSDGDPQTGQFRVGAITYSPDKILSNTAMPVSEEEPEHLDPGPERPEQEQPEAEKPADEKGEPLIMPEAGSPPQGKKKWGLFSYLMLAALVLLCIGWWFLPKASDSPLLKKTEPVTIEQPPASQPQAAPAAAQSAKTLSAGEQVKQFFNNVNPQAAAALELASKLPSTSVEDQDALYRLYYFAAEKNDVKAWLKYAQCLDPSLPQWGTIQKDGTEAIHAYSQAAQANPVEAKEAQMHLMAWLEDQAGKGNAKAQAWLNEIKK